MLKLAEIRNMDEHELQDKLGQFKKDLMQHRFQAKTGKLERQSTIRDLKRDIARILTVMNEKTATETKTGEGQP